MREQFLSSRNFNEFTNTTQLGPEAVILQELLSSQEKAQEGEAGEAGGGEVGEGGGLWGQGTTVLQGPAISTTESRLYGLDVQ